MCDVVGEHDGMFGSKRFFSCPGGHGLIVPANKVHQLPSSANVSQQQSMFVGMFVYVCTCVCVFSRGREW